MPRCPLAPLAVVLLVALPAVVRAQPKTAAAKEFEPAVQALDQLIAREVADKHLPALSIALVDDQKIVWARGYGFADAARKKPATADTVYRVGSVSKLFTDIAVMQLVEQGKLDLDAPVTKYLSDFKPLNKYDKPITLRMLMSHRAGLVREPPEGNYFDPSVTALDRTVRSLNRTELVYEPGTRTRYSNAGIAVVGFVIEETQQQRFARHLHNRVLDPLGMTHSAFEPSPDTNKDLAEAVMWGYDGREFPAPTFELGMAPAGSMYSTVNDLGRFLSALFAGGKGQGGQVIETKTLEQMLTPQFVKEGEKTGFGIGFSIADLDGHKRIGHGGAIYGFATELAALPSEKLGVVVVTSRDVANGVTRHIANEALKQMLAVRNKKPLPKIEETQPVGAERARKLAGHYAGKEGKGIELSERDGRLYALSLQGGSLTELRALGDSLVTDSPLGYGQKFEVKDDKLVVDKDTYERVPTEKAKPVPEKWRGLIGEYGWDHNVLYIFEKDGKLWALIEWIEFDPLEAVSDDVLKFPEAVGMYHGEKLIFTRGKDGRATQAQASGVIFERRPIQGEDGSTFRIKPQRPVADLRREALKEKPPEEKGDFRKPDLVDLTTLDDSFKLDIRYATDNNFLGTPLYSSAKAYMQRPAAEALARVNKALAAQGFGLLIHDAYRPWYVTKMFWEATPEKQRIFVADPSKGSRHNRGCAVDLTLYDRKTGKVIEMVGGYDEMTDRSFADYPGGTSLQREHREVLRRAMEAEGFAVYEWEWWHFDYKDWRKYPILNLTFEELKK
jgi:CubicO group peptidase (beta-lactamase class C family)/D-alanyl-D-alanine dipeptidase